MRKTRFAAGLAACLMALSGCGDSATSGTDDDTQDATIPVGSGVDTDGDGDTDGTAIDTNGDKVADAIDTNGDGQSDGPIPKGSKAASAGGEDAGEATAGGATAGGATAGGATAGGATAGGATAGGATAGGTTGVDAGMATGGKDAGQMACMDNPSTKGNDCPGLVTCSDAVNSCSVSTQNCCVKDYDPKAVSCNQGPKCDGLAKAVCDGPEDCPSGQQCCISVSVGGGGTEIKHRCVANRGACTGGFIANSILCHTDENCVAGQICEPIGKLPFWSICKGNQ